MIGSPRAHSSLVKQRRYPLEFMTGKSKSANSMRPNKNLFKKKFNDKDESMKFKNGKNFIKLRSFNS